MPTILPKDAGYNAIQCLRLRAGKAHSVSVAAETARNATAFDSETRVVSVYATGPCFIKSGDSSVTAATTDHYLPAGTLMYLSLGNADQGGRHDHFAVIRASYDCTLYISEME